MDVFDLRNRLVDDYANYTRSFITIADPRIKTYVEQQLQQGVLWPEPLLQLNPSFFPGGTIDDGVADGTLHPECARIFRINKTDVEVTGQALHLHTHQVDAIRQAKRGRSYVLISGTGSGKSLAYIIPIVDHVLRRGSGQGIQAIVVYPMNALANSQAEELKKFLEKGYGEGQSPLRFARFTGQDQGAERENIRKNPPDILLTNYMMLELLLTRREDRELVRAARDLRFLVFDELHTYRGRQGADIALLIRRCRLALGGHDFICVGTSATMASAGTSEDQRREVAAVAQTLFGTAIAADQVIGETLERATPDRDFTDPATVTALTAALATDAEPPATYEAFRVHPLASWIESTFGVQMETATGRWIRQPPRQLRGKGSAVAELAALTGLDADSCDRVLRQFLTQGSQLRRTASSRFPIFAFRLHQFFTRGDTVWTTLETEPSRYLSLVKQGAQPGEPDKPLFPLVFCRQCGAAYYRVSVHIDEDGQRRLLPREDRREVGDDGQGDAYLYLSATHPWPRDDESARLARLPESFKETTAQGIERIRPEAREDVPTVVFVDAAGRIVAEGAGVEAALIRHNFLFCLNPACGVAYTKTQRSERGKLSTLGVDNRSTATTILAVRALIELQGDRDLQPEARKLLSFTDNRQDASLQAGHFNDFAQVMLLRSALHQAMQAQGARGLTHSELSRQVFDALKLPFADYAADPDVRGPARSLTDDALRQVIDYYLYRDLQRGWRWTVPNLEDCDLLVFEYVGLTGPDGLLADPEVWEAGLTVSGEPETASFVAAPPTVQACPSAVREALLRTLLDVLRHGLAVKVDVLDGAKQRDWVEKTKPRLREDTVWYLEDSRELIKATVAYPQQGQRDDRNGLFISSYGSYGRYLRRLLKPYAPPGQHFRREDVDAVIRFLLLALKRYGIVEQVRGGEVPAARERGRRPAPVASADPPTPGYQINPAALRWLPGSGEIRPLDPTRLVEAGEIPPEVNRYFVECYRHFIHLQSRLEAREHTAQVAAEDRQDREDRFRAGNLPLLFCSPTMELGVDIAQLNVVNLRNVPPTPANYAQRSGRAGRGGQPALVYTYCAGRSPHDQYYYHRSQQMVGGVVAPPRIDLRNRDLVRSHLHALWMEVAKPDLGQTLTTVLDMEPQTGQRPLPIQDGLKTTLTDPTYRATALAKAQTLLAGIQDLLSTAPWFHPHWAKDTLDSLERAFDDACERWRELYRAAVRQRELHHQIIIDHSRAEAERQHSKRLRAQAESQIKLLTDIGSRTQGDFYSYRYFATEGFLPGYNFPRLPISAYVPARRQRGYDEFISRPRFLALAEFGPRALIYHEGARYRVYKVNLDFGSDDLEASRALATHTLKRCPACGYAHLEQGVHLADVCDRCDAALDETSLISELVHLRNVSLKLAQRITCDEEERQRFGYRIVTAYRFPEVGGKLDRRDAEVKIAGVPVLSLSYGDATDLYRINLGWANQHQREAPGFKLDVEKGYWSSNQADDQDQDDAAREGRVVRVVPYVRDTKNALVLRVEPARSLEEMASLQAALAEAIQKHFQLEPRELATEALPSSRDRREILFYEAAEGGAGVLRQLVEDPQVIPALARRALEICHFDPDTLHDDHAERCGKACYECLLDYGNQPDHPLLDRYRIRDFLAALIHAECRPAGGTGSREERLAELLRRCDSQLERRWLEQVEALKLRLPSDGQYLIESCSTRPDFYYADGGAAIYVDGPPHDTPEQIHTDEAITARLQEAGYAVIRFHHQADWAAIFQRHPDIFGVPQA